jgi:hypothetical protein
MKAPFHDSSYQAHWNGASAAFITLHDRLLQIQLPYGPELGELHGMRV